MFRKTNTGNYKNENNVWIWKSSNGRITKGHGYYVGKSLYNKNTATYCKTLKEAKSIGENI